MWVYPADFSAQVVCSGSGAETSASASVFSRTRVPGLPGRSLSIPLKIQKAVLWVCPALFSAQVVCSGSGVPPDGAASLFSRTKSPPVYGQGGFLFGILLGKAALLPAQVVCSESGAQTYASMFLFSRTRQRALARQRARQKPAFLRPASHGLGTGPSPGPLSRTCCSRRSGRRRSRLHAPGGNRTRGRTWRT